MRSRLHIGLTGGIGSGKSTVARLLCESGAHLVDTDALARVLTAPGGQALPALRAGFGDEIFDDTGQLRRERLRQLVFNHAEQRQLLESILHPMIFQLAWTQAACAAPHDVVVFDVPLLAESQRWRVRVDRVLVVDCEVDTQIQRVRARSSWSDEQTRAVMATQATRAERAAVADAVLYNDGIDMAALTSQVHALWALWRPCETISRLCNPSAS